MAHVERNLTELGVRFVFLCNSILVAFANVSCVIPEILHRPVVSASTGVLDA